MTVKVKRYEDLHDESWLEVTRNSSLSWKISHSEVEKYTYISLPNFYHERGKSVTLFYCYSYPALQLIESTYSKKTIGLRSISYLCIEI